MSPVDPATFGTRTPRAFDGRKYPAHLRPYERYDKVMLPLVEALVPATFDDLSLRVADPHARAALPRWLASAEWRGLIERRDSEGLQTRSYGPGPAAAGRTERVA
jgi:hypothetical protein